MQNKESDVYEKKPFHDRPQDHNLILDIFKGKGPEVTEDAPEFYADLIKKMQRS